MILGRDFLQKYDVLVDLHRHRIKIRNPKQEYQLRVMHHVDESRRMSHANFKGGINLQPQTMDRYPLNLKQIRKKEHQPGDDLPHLVYIEPLVSAEDNPTISVGRTVAILQNGMVDTSIANLDLERELIAKPENTNARVYPVRAEVQRIPINYIHDRNSSCSSQSSSEDSESDVQTSISDSTEDSDFSEISSLNQTIPESRSNYPCGPTPAEWPCRPVYDPDRIGMSEDQQERLDALFETYGDVFSTHPGDIGQTDRMEHPITLEEGAGYFYETPRRMTPERHLAADQQVQALLEMGLIEPSRSPYASGIVMVKKPDGAQRLCVDYRNLNDLTKKDRFPIPHIKDTLDSIGNARFFSTFDMGSAFHQVPIRPEDREKTAFVIPGGFFQWKYMPFGLCNAPATFQRLMANVLAPISKKYGNLVLCYIDDILIATRTIEEHLDRIEEVFQHIREAGLKFKAKKCFLFKKEVKYLGSLISSEGIVMQQRGIDKIQAWAIPTNRTELKSFLGFANYYREFIRGYSHIAAPMISLDRKNKENPKDTSILWNDEAQEAFDALKKAFTEAPVLSLPSE
ncbi:MAG: RNA-directed DNA polymerase, partial [Planctomycetaceae bacterium]|nr:RNA-directed DNA polymerase [Planctomycetaceae bacterium]